MKLLIMHMPGRASKQELTKFIRSATGGLTGLLPFVSKPFLRKCETICIEDRSNNAKEYHALITIEPDKAGQAVIKRLNGRRFKGVRVVVKPYTRRSYYKDRRRKYADLELLPVERRYKDRRRPALSIRTVDCGQFW